jgi:hypothetical protein
MIDGDNLMDDTYRWELIDTLKSARLADWLITQPDINQRLFIDAAKLLEQDADRIELLEYKAKYGVDND